MQDDSSRHLSEQLLRWLLPVAILAVGAAAAAFLIVHRPQAERQVVPESVALVDVTTASPGTARIIVDAMGTVIPAREVDLTSEVSGRIVRQNPNLVPGGRLKSDEVVVRIDPDDYLLDVTQRVASVEQARLELRLEEGRKAVAEREWQLFDQEVEADEAARDVALRKPHIRSARAAVAGAEGALERSRLNLERTIVRTPFDAVVIDEFTDVGQVISPQTPIARIVATDRFFVRASLPVESLAWIDLPDQNGKGGSPAVVFQEVTPGVEAPRRARVVRLLGNLETAGRMARVLVSVADPLDPTSALSTPSAPLLLGSYVRVEIGGIEVHDAFTVPREAVRDGHNVWIMNDRDRLEIRPVRILWGRKNAVLVKDGLKEGERIVTSRLALATPGMKLKVVDAPGPTDNSTENGEETGADG